MQTPPLLILLGWSAQTKMYPSISSRLSGVEESGYVSDKHMKSCLYIEIYAFICVSFDLRSYEQINYEIPMTDRKGIFLSFFGPEFGSISSWQSKRTKIHRRVITLVYAPSR